MKAADTVVAGRRERRRSREKGEAAVDVSSEFSILSWMHREKVGGGNHSNLFFNSIAQTWNIKLYNYIYKIMCLFYIIKII